MIDLVKHEIMKKTNVNSFWYRLLLKVYYSKECSSLSQSLN